MDLLEVWTGHNVPHPLSVSGQGQHFSILVTLHVWQKRGSKRTVCSILLKCGACHPLQWSSSPGQPEGWLPEAVFFQARTCAERVDHSSAFVKLGIHMWVNDSLALDTWPLCTNLNWDVELTSLNPILRLTGKGLNPAPWQF